MESMNLGYRLTDQQTDCLDHLSGWRVGAVFMDMGTGKTRVAVEIIKRINPDHVLWVGPLRTLDAVGVELRKWGCDTDCIRFVGVESIGQSERIYLEVQEWMCTTRDILMIVDESLKIKNAGAKRTKRVLDLGKKASYRFVLNGTPLSRNLLDLWSQMEFLSPRILNMSRRKFMDTFCSYKTVVNPLGWSKDIITGYENVDYLYSLIRNYVYRCDLKLNIEQSYKTVSYWISEESYQKYQNIKNEYLSPEKLDEMNDNIFLAMTTSMQMAYCVDICKFEALDKLFLTVPQNKTLIYCRFVKSVEACKERYPEARVLSYQKESFGLNLQEYCHTVYFDKVWDMALRVQSGRRTFRIGQEHECFYYDLTGNVGLEKLIDLNIEKKIGISEYFKSKTKEEIKKDLG